MVISYTAPTAHTDRQAEAERQAGRETGRQRDRQAERQGDGETERDIDIEGRQSNRYIDTQGWSYPV